MERHHRHRGACSLPVNSIRELVQMAKTQPGKLNWAGTTGAIDFLFAGFLKHNDLNIERVPYRNPQDAANDLATGRVKFARRPLPRCGRNSKPATSNCLR